MGGRASEREAEEVAAEEEAEEEENVNTRERRT